MTPHPKASDWLQKLMAAQENLPASSVRLDANEGVGMHNNTSTERDAKESQANRKGENWSTRAALQITAVQHGHCTQPCTLRLLLMQVQLRSVHHRQATQ
jgi:hypothetical protein